MVHLTNGFNHGRPSNQSIPCGESVADPVESRPAASYMTGPPRSKLFESDLAHTPDMLSLTNACILFVVVARTK